MSTAPTREQGLRGRIRRDCSNTHPCSMHGQGIAAGGRSSARTTGLILPWLFCKLSTLLTCGRNHRGQLLCAHTSIIYELVHRLRLCMRRTLGTRAENTGIRTRHSECSSSSYSFRPWCSMSKMFEGVCEIPNGPTFCHLDAAEAELFFHEVRWPSSQ